MYRSLKLRSLFHTPLNVSRINALIKRMVKTIYVLGTELSLYTQHTVVLHTVNNLMSPNEGAYIDTF